ncbi:MAG TPA: YraN family protein [Terriglobales bacterium]|nr:YraN family protein [Terriglobales bacterium]
MKGRFTRAVLRLLDAFFRLENGKSHPAEKPAHLVTGQLGEEAAYFFLREQGYVVVARNFRSPRHRGEIDLIAWDGKELCFVEVKTRSRHSFVPAEAAVDAPKQATLRATARTYLRKLKEVPPVRFDVVSLYRNTESGTPEFTLFKDAFPMS